MKVTVDATLCIISFGVEGKLNRAAEYSRWVIRFIRTTDYLLFTVIFGAESNFALAKRSTKSLDIVYYQKGVYAERPAGDENHPGFDGFRHHPGDVIDGGEEERRALDEYAWGV